MRKQPKRQRVTGHGGREQRTSKKELEEMFSAVPLQVYLDMCDILGVGPYKSTVIPTDPTVEVWHSDFYRLEQMPELMFTLNKYKVNGEWEIDLAFVTEEEIGHKILGARTFDLTRYWG